MLLLAVGRGLARVVIATESSLCLFMGSKLIPYQVSSRSVHGFSRESVTDRVTFAFIILVWKYGLVWIFIVTLLCLLVLTGALWGCTNPFIRQGTKGLRDVTATSWRGQAWAEVTFLLGNWKYVVPWLVNQCGSLAYLASLGRAPLSLAVPAANSLAFVFTAATGAASGLEEPLDARSIMGIVLIMAGTALCCQDAS